MGFEALTQLSQILNPQAPMPVSMGTYENEMKRYGNYPAPTTNLRAIEESLIPWGMGQQASVPAPTPAARAMVPGPAAPPAQTQPAKPSPPERTYEEGSRPEGPSWIPQGQFAASEVPSEAPVPDWVRQQMSTALRGQEESAVQNELSDPNRWMMLAAALASPGDIGRKLQLMSLSQMAYGELKQAEALAKTERDREFGMKKEESGALVGERKARTRQLDQATEESREKAPLEIKKLREELSELELKRRKALREYDAKLAVDPTGAKEAQANLDKIEAEIAQKRAAANASNASAGASSATAAKDRASTEGIQDTNKARKTILDPSASTEERERAQVVVSGGKSAAAQKKDHLQVVADFYKKANPGISDSDAATYALEAERGTKGEELRAATALLQNAADDTTRRSAEETLKSILQRSVKTGTKPGTETAAAVVKAPVDAKARVVNTIYSTPKGNLRWTGTGWVVP